MGNWWWSYLLTAIGILGIYMAGKRNKYGWAIGLFAQALWFLYAVTTQQWGFILSAFAYGAVYFKNYAAWTKEKNASRQEEGAIPS